MAESSVDEFNERLDSVECDSRIRTIVNALRSHIDGCGPVGWLAHKSEGGWGIRASVSGRIVCHIDPRPGGGNVSVKVMDAEPGEFGQGRARLPSQRRSALGPRHRPRHGRGPLPTDLASVRHGAGQGDTRPCSEHTCCTWRSICRASSGDSPRPRCARGCFRWRRCRCAASAGGAGLPTRRRDPSGR